MALVLTIESGFFFTMIERKCGNCGSWNKDEDYCVFCKAPLSPKAIDREKTIQLKKEAEAIPLPKEETTPPVTNINLVRLFPINRS